MWDISTGRALCGAPAPLDGRVRAVAFLRHSNQSFISAGELAVSAWEYDETSKRLSFQQVRLGILKRDILSIAIDEDDKYVYLGTSSADVLCVALSNHTIKESFTLKKYISKGICSLAIVRNAILAGSGDGVAGSQRVIRSTCGSAEWSAKPRASAAAAYRISPGPISSQTPRRPISDTSPACSS